MNESIALLDSECYVHKLWNCTIRSQKCTKWTNVVQETETSSPTVTHLDFAHFGLLGDPA
ncbi:hypothetical protein BLOT_012418 [Blomia tropicalis]|nr:hypothetical protein BLOT_012418 [Blomia tropicalis]